MTEIDTELKDFERAGLTISNYLRDTLAVDRNVLQRIERLAKLLVDRCEIQKLYEEFIQARDKL